MNKMSDCGSLEEIKRKIREGIYSTFAKVFAKKRTVEIEGISTVEDGKIIKLLYVHCTRYSSILKYNSKTSGTSHIRHHAGSCQTKSGS